MNNTRELILIILTPVVVVLGLSIGLAWFFPNKTITWEDKTQICIEDKGMMTFEENKYCIKK